MRVTVQQIEVFLAVAGSRSISEAAREIYISQPALSSTIAELERRLGVTLLTRSNKGVILTDEGRRLYAELDPIYKRFVIWTSRVIDGKDASGANVLNIGALHTPDAIRVMLSVIEKHRQLYPDISLTKEYYSYHELRNSLLCKDLDVAFTFSYEIMGCPDLVSRRIHAIKQYFVIPAKYCDVDGSDFRFLRDKQLILEVSLGRETMLNICSAHGFQPKCIKFVSSYPLLAQMIADGEGFTIGGRSLPNLSSFARDIAFVPVAAEDCNEYVQLVAAWRRGDDRPEIKNLLAVTEMPTVRNNAACIDKTPGSKWFA